MSRYILVCLIAISLSPALSSAHTRWALDGSAPPRSSNANLKTGPCGNVERTSTPTPFNVGETITLSWDETINHPGYYRIAFSMANDEGFDEHVLVESILDNQGSELPTPHRFSTTVTLPNTVCTECTLQIIQVMTENPERPRNYYSCADIMLVDLSSETPEPEPMPPETTLSTTEIALALLQDFAQLDTNIDTHIDINEYAQAITDTMLMHFSVIDTDTNGLLSATELSSAEGIDVGSETEAEEEASVKDESGSIYPFGIFLLLLVLGFRRKRVTR